ncbi:MAG: hypothetical protein ACREMH_10150 [Gemmatimonadales bacterium]
MRSHSLLASVALSALAAATPARALAQGVLVAPHALIVDHSARSGTLTLYNPGTEPVEVEVGTLFGYPASDSTGRLYLHTDAAPAADEPSASAWLEAFPRRVTIAPLQRQTVRVLARPPAGLPDGEYWSRIVVAARGGQVPVTGVTDTARIQVGLSLEVRTVISFNYRKGPVATSVSLDQLRAEPVGDSLRVRLRLVRGGNAAWLGTVRVTLTGLDGDAGQPRATESALAVYHTLEPALAVPLSGLAPGRYRLMVEAVTEREDITDDQLLRAQPVRGQIEVRLP